MVDGSESRKEIEHEKEDSGDQIQKEELQAILQVQEVGKTAQDIG